MLSGIINNIKKFREQLYYFFHCRRDASMELVDSLSSNTEARSVVELSLNPVHRRNYCSITRVLDELKQKEAAKSKEQDKKLIRLLSRNCLNKQERAYHLFVVDCTPNPRVFSPTLKDRSYVYSSNAVPGTKPVTIGHKFSIAAYLPEKNREDAPWIIPLSCERVKSEEKGNLVGMEQLAACIQSQELFVKNLCVSVSDCDYSNPLCLGEAKKNPNLVHISRSRNSRNFYSIFEGSNEERKRGRPKKYGDIHQLHHEETWKAPKESIEFTMKNKKNKIMIVTIDGWDSLIMRGKKGCPLSDYPFRLLRIRVYKESGELLYNRPLWLIAAGERRGELTLREIFESYRQRFDIEHFFRFGKTRLLLDKSQTPDVEHEEAWWKLVLMSYNQLYLARELAENMPNPWEKYLPEFKSSRAEKSPTQVQKNFGRIIREIGTPAKPPKPHKKSLGREKGQTQNKRKRYPVVVVSKKRKQSENEAKMKA